MRLDAVYVLAPKPKPPSMPTRRAFLMAGVAFIAGTSLGGACGYAMGSQQAGGVVAGPEEKPKDEPLVSSGNAELDELRRLAVKAPIEELMGRAEWFFERLHEDYARDDMLWTGVGRICEAITQGFEMANRRVFARLLAQFIEKGHPEVAAPFMHHVQNLRAIK